MQTLVIGRFSQYEQAESTASRLMDAGFHPQGMSLFYLGPPGQHKLFPLGGDEYESAGTHEASRGALKGAAGGVGAGALIGAAAAPVVGTAAPLLGAAVGAYTGSFVGALKSMEEPADDNGEPRDSTSPSVLLAVAVATPKQDAKATSILEQFADQVEHAEGILQDGEWIDFDPLAVNHKIQQGGSGR